MPAHLQCRIDQCLVVNERSSALFLYNLEVMSITAVIIRTSDFQWIIDKKLSYRKQTARQLRTQYVEGIYSNSVTLKSGLEVTQGD